MSDVTHLLHNMSPELWMELLTETFDVVSRTKPCAPILEDIGLLKFQLTFEDRPEMNYWEHYQGSFVEPHLGTVELPDLMIKSLFPVIVDTLTDRLSVMEAAADELYEIYGDTTSLMKCANVLPYVMLAFTRAASQRFPKLANEQD
ncbi:MAG: hypothetical protein H6741_19010 [Alphaproteobacteria bacterium]|nr:hypothetical protein [Alphaproteobacteria bacterium]MCB9794801.1 hypothetical protein [Alphaproteobacteria bacterium]